MGSSLLEGRTSQTQEEHKVNIGNRFLEVKNELDEHAKLSKNRDAEDWKYACMEEGFILNEGVDPDRLEEFSHRCPLEIPAFLKKAWLSANGFKGAWKYEYEYRPGEKATASVSFGLLPMEEAFGGLNYIENMCDRMESDALLQWCILNPERYESLAEFGYKDPAVMTFDVFESLIRNMILLECFTVDNQYYTLLKLDAKEGEPTLYLSYEHGIYPLDLNLEEYFEKMFTFRGVIWPWPLLFVKEENLDNSLKSEIEEKREKAERFAEDLGFDTGAVRRQGPKN